jgi:hypothetical protein
MVVIDLEDEGANLVADFVRRLDRGGLIGYLELRHGSAGGY